MGRGDGVSSVTFSKYLTATGDSSGVVQDGYVNVLLPSHSFGIFRVC